MTGADIAASDVRRRSDLIQRGGLALSRSVALCHEARVLQQQAARLLAESRRLVVVGTVLRGGSDAVPPLGDPEHGVTGIGERCLLCDDVIRQAEVVEIPGAVTAYAHRACWTRFTAGL